MYIESLVIKGLYSHYDKNLKFKKDCTLLVGINGSGKTTILRIINWLLTPSIPDLSSTKFDKIKMVFYHEDIKYTILCEQDSLEMKYHLTAGSKQYEPLVASLEQDPSSLNSDFRRRETMLRRYKGLMPESKEMETWDAIRRIPSPVFLGVDRSPLSCERELDSPRNLSNKSEKGTGLDYSSQLLTRASTEENASVLDLTERIKSKLMVYAFDAVVDINEVLPVRSYLPSRQEIEMVESRVVDLCKSDLINQDDLNNVRQYFKRLKKLIGNDTKNDSDAHVNFVLNIKQYEKVKRILNDFEDFEAKKKQATSKTDAFISIMNDFLKDSNKAIYINPSSSKVEYRIFDKNGRIVEEGLDIHYLASGEQQLFILFSNIILGTPNHIYIIDEPELSLHVKWLEMLYPHLEDVFPKENQLIIATHSPILADKKRDSALVLYPY